MNTKGFSIALLLPILLALILLIATTVLPGLLDQLQPILEPSPTTIVHATPTFAPTHGLTPTGLPTFVPTEIGLSPTLPITTHPTISLSVLPSLTSVLSPTEAEAPTRAATPTTAPTHGPSPTSPPTSGGIPSSYLTWGIYPNCKAPAVPIESQAWWHEKSSPLSSDGNTPAKMRHLHYGSCIPNARSANGKEVVLESGYHNYVNTIIMHNNPGGVAWADGACCYQIGSTLTLKRTHPSLDWQESSGGGGCAGGSSTCVTFNPKLTCPPGQTCRFDIPMRTHIPANLSGYNGLAEWRMKPNMTAIEPRNDRQFTTFNAQVHLGGSRNYRNGPGPIARGWYTGLDYANAGISNYMDLFKGRTDISIPIVSGTIDLRTNHAQCSGSNAKSIFRIDPNGHADNPGTLIYEKPGCFSGTVSLDTTKLSNGIHTLFLQTSEDNQHGTNFGILKLLIDVRN